MTAKEEISAWIASCAENGIPHPCKQCSLQKKFYYSDSMVDKLLGYRLSSLLLFHTEIKSVNNYCFQKFQKK